MPLSFRFGRDGRAIVDAVGERGQQDCNSRGSARYNEKARPPRAALPRERLAFVVAPLPYFETQMAQIPPQTRALSLEVAASSSSGALQKPQMMHVRASSLADGASSSSILVVFG